MDPGLARDALTALAGVGTGTLSAAFGVGGAVVSTPAIRVLGASAATAVGTTLPSILPSAVSGALRYNRQGLIDWAVVRVAVPTGMVASVVGSVASHAVPGDGHWLMVFTAVLLGVTAFRTARGSDVIVADTGALPISRLVVAAVGAAAGGLSGLLGVGGGIVMVPGFTELAHLPLKRAIATSLVCVGAFAVPGTITHALLGGVDWRFAALLAVGVIPGARLGAASAIRASDARLRNAVAVFLGLIALVYFVGELRAV